MARAIDYTTRQEYLDFAAGVLQCNPFDEDARTIAYLECTGQIVAVAVFDHWHASGHAELSLATNGDRSWSTRSYLNAIYMLAFTHFGLRRVNMVCDAANEPAVQMHTKLGHVIEGHLQDWFADGQPAILWRYSVKDYAASRWNKWRLEQVSRGRYDVQDLERRTI